MKTLLSHGVKLNNKDNLARYVFYTEGRWNLGLRLPSTIDYKEFYIIEHGSTHAVIL